jgi:hypothetical protein
MQANIDKWVRLGLVGLPLYGALTFWASLNPQPNPDAQFTQWAQYVTTDAYVIRHMLGSGLGLIFAMFGTFALGAYLTRGRGPHVAMTAISLSLIGLALFLMLVGVSTFAVPLQGHAHLAGIDEFAQLPPTFGDAALGVVFLGVIAFNLAGNALLGIAIWRSGSLPKWTGAAWALAALLMYALGIVYSVVSGSQSTPPTVLIGAAIVVIAGGWITYSAARSPLVPATA